uniref:NADH dehydrogenase subunit 2 n=1 Tax=Eurhadina cuii TaxID=1287892 RepID=UPI0022DCDE85|nr:NADH dehydrogenase subunit 2 [Eurhadina cuii]UGN61485.1 NADH dehydrogenase subunit 2 [Eurhadina cuii]
MKMNSSTILFYMTMMMGISMSISSSSWIMIWCGLEISLISIIPLMISKSIISSESVMKYFITQSVSSMMLMLGMLIMVMSGDYNYNYMLTTSLLIKMGVAPFHNWVLTVIEGLNWIMMLTILTINKIAPLTMLSYIFSDLVVTILITVILGAVMGMNQNSIKKLIGYSSIFNMGFIISVLKLNLMWSLYLFIYSTLMIMLTTLIMNNKVMYINQMTFVESIMNSISMWMIMLSMGGMPPLMGFFIKYMVITYLIDMKMILMVLTMVMTSLIIMFFYLRMMFMSILNNSLMIYTKMFQLNEISSNMLIINLITMPILMLMKIFI